jgi:hypothetical protein
LHNLILLGRFIIRAAPTWVRERILIGVVPFVNSL